MPRTHATKLPPAELKARAWTLETSCFAPRLMTDHSFYDTEPLLRRAFEADWKARAE